MQYLNPLKGFIGLLLFCTMHDAFSILPPYYQSIREIEQILNSNEVADKLSAYPIQSIIRTDTDGITYLITVKDCTLKVNIIYKASKKGFVGPAEFDIVPGSACHK